MARYRCRNCGWEDTFVHDEKYEGALRRCSIPQFASTADELSDDDLLNVAMKTLAKDTED
jgi:hypothetical protein